MSVHDPNYRGIGYVWKPIRSRRNRTEVHQHNDFIGGQIVELSDEEATIALAPMGDLRVVELAAFAADVDRTVAAPVVCRVARDAGGVPVVIEVRPSRYARNAMSTSYTLLSRDEVGPYNFGVITEAEGFDPIYRD